MNSQMLKQMAWGFTAANAAFLAVGIALAVQHDAPQVQSDVQRTECAPTAATKADCPACLTWGQMFPLPPDMPASEPIAQF